MIFSADISRAKNWSGFKKCDVKVKMDGVKA